MALRKIRDKLTHVCYPQPSGSRPEQSRRLDASVWRALCEKRTVLNENGWMGNLTCWPSYKPTPLTFRVDKRYHRNMKGNQK